MQKSAKYVSWPKQRQAANGNIWTLKRHLKSKLKTLNLLNFAKGTTFYRNKEIIFLYTVRCLVTFF